MAYTWPPPEWKTRPRFCPAVVCPWFFTSLFMVAECFKVLNRTVSIARVNNPFLTNVSAEGQQREDEQNDPGPPSRLQRGGPRGQVFKNPFPRNNSNNVNNINNICYLQATVLQNFFMSLERHHNTHYHATRHNDIQRSVTWHNDTA
jgi:hypothetical protein